MNIAGTGFPTSECAISSLDESNTIDAAVKHLDDIISVINLFKDRLKRAKENGCDYLVDYDYTKLEDFDFDDKEDDDD